MKLAGGELLVTVAVLSVLMADPAGATGTIGCRSVDASTPAAVEINVGQLPALVPIWVRVTVGEMRWTSPGGDAGTLVTILQSFDDGRSLVIDLAEPNVEKVLFSIRLFRDMEGRDLAHAGTLRGADIGAFALVCQGP